MRLWKKLLFPVIVTSIIYERFLNSTDALEIWIVTEATSNFFSSPLMLRWWWSVREIYGCVVCSRFTPVIHSLAMLLHCRRDRKKEKKSWERSLVIRIRWWSSLRVSKSCLWMKMRSGARIIIVYTFLSSFLLHLLNFFSFSSFPLNALFYFFCVVSFPPSL